MTFLPEPRPDRITRMEDRLTLTVGVQEITQTPRGLKVVPHKAVVVELGDRAIDIDPRMAREWALRVIAMCDHIEAGA